MELISVIVPVYNRSIYLRDAIESILNQTHDNLEVLLIDDGSSDHALDIMKEYERIDRRVITYTKRNGGICDAVRMGVMLSRGEYIARLDSDDINSPTRYEKQLRFLKEGGYDVVGCYIRGFGDSEIEQINYLEACVNKPMRSDEETYKRFLLGQGITGSTIFGRGDIFRSVKPFHRDYSIIEDYYLSIMLYKEGKRISILEEKELNYRVHDNNLSLSGDKDLIKKHTEISFLYMFREKIYKSKRVIIFRMRYDSYYIYEIIDNYFSDIKGRFHVVNEDEVEEFIKNNSHIMGDIHGNIVFYGVNFSGIGKFFMKSYGYELYVNIFLSGN